MAIILSNMKKLLSPEDLEQINDLANFPGASGGKAFLLAIKSADTKRVDYEFPRLLSTGFAHAYWQKKFDWDEEERRPGRRKVVKRPPLDQSFTMEGNDDTGDAAEKLATELVHSSPLIAVPISSSEWQMKRISSLPSGVLGDRPSPVSVGDYGGHSGDSGMSDYSTITSGDTTLQSGESQ